MYAKRRKTTSTRRSAVRRPRVQSRASRGKSITSLSNADYVGEGGRRLGSALWKMTGLGDYQQVGFKVSNNSLMDEALMEGGPPALQSTKDRAFNVKHREYLGDFYSASVTGGFSIASYPLQPGSSVTFPWLASMAQNFQCYRINGCIIEAKSLSADISNGVQTSVGACIISTNYNAGDPAFVSKQQMENTEFASSCKPSKSMLHPIECKRNITPVSELYVRTGAVPAGQDVRLYDFANVFVATAGIPAANIPIFELWISYDITFYKPILEVGLGSGIGANADHWAATNASNVNWFGTGAVRPGSSIGCSFGAYPGFGGAIQFPQSDMSIGDEFMVFHYMTSTLAAVGITNPTIAAVGNGACSIVSYFANGAVGIANSGSVTAQNQMFGYIVKILALNVPAIITYSGGGTFTSPNNCDVVVSQIPFSILN